MVCFKLFNVFLYIFKGVWSWTTDDLTPIPMSQGEGEFWAPGRPNYGNAAQCLWLGISSPYDYRFDDIDCNWASWTMCTICEKDVLV